MKAKTAPPFRLPLRLFCAAALALTGGPLASSQTPRARASGPAPCTAPEHRQFDFWLGDWDTFESGAPDKVVARNRVDSILGGCVLREVHEQGDGLTGQSFTIYDAARKVAPELGDEPRPATRARRRHAGRPDGTHQHGARGGRQAGAGARRVGARGGGRARDGGNVRRRRQDVEAALRHIISPTPA
jgi:hypothetical protein